jgi:hypothetical protein
MQELNIYCKGEIMKSGIEMIESLYRKVDLLERRFEVIEQNTKEILNRVNGFEKPKQPNDINKPTIASLTPTISEQKPKLSSKNNVKVIGKIKNKEGKAICSVNIKIFNEQNQIIKETRTNKAGEWMCFLPPGKYGAEYFLENIIQANINFNISPEQKLLRVAQPQL